jgi:hypothetical protein
MLALVDSFLVLFLSFVGVIAKHSAGASSLQTVELSPQHNASCELNHTSVVNIQLARVSVWGKPRRRENSLQ